MKARCKERSPGVWQITLELGVGPNGKRRREYHTVHGGIRKAQQEANRLLAAAEAGNLTTHKSLTVAQFLELWLAKHAKRNCRAKTYEDYEDTVRKHLIPCLGAAKLTKLTGQQLDDYYEDRLARGRRQGVGGLAPRSVLHHHRLLHTAFEYAVKHQYLERNPAKVATAPKVTAPEHEVLDEEETWLLMDAVKESHWYLPVMLAVIMGMRRGEVLGLRWDTVDLVKKRMYIKETYGRLKSGPTFGQPKTHRSKRPLVIPDFLVGALLAEKDAQAARHQRYGDAYPESGMVCPNAEGRPWSPNAMGQAFTHLISHLPITQVTYHELRHSHITQMLERGENLKVISERVGHASAAFTLAVYGHVLKGAEEQLAARLDAHYQQWRQRGDPDAQLTADPAAESHFATQMATNGRQDEKTTPARGRRIIRVQARN